MKAKLCDLASRPARPLRLLAASAAAVLLVPAVATAQAAAEPGATGASEGETIFSLLLKGGWLMVPIAICSVVALMFAIERAVSLRRARTIPPGLLDDLYEILPAVAPTRGDQREAADHLQHSQSILGDTLRPGVLRIHRGREHAEAHLEDAAAKQVHVLKRKLKPFAVVASLAPLLGLLGTIYGMISCFETAASTDAASRTEVLARGIYAALVTTAAGISVAIPALVLFHIFDGRVDRIVDRVEEGANDFLEHYFEDPHPQRLARAPAGAPVEPPAGEPV